MVNARTRTGFAFLGAFLVAAATTVAQNSLGDWYAFLDSVKGDLKSDSYLVQIDALEKFRAQDGLSAAEFLVDLIENDRRHPAVFKKAGEILGTYRDERARKAVAVAFVRDPTKSRHLLNAYVHQEHQDRWEITVTTLHAAREDPSIQAEAIDLLGRRSPPGYATIELLIEHMGERHHHSVRKAAALACGRVPSKAVIDPLIDALPDKVIGGWARDSLFRLTGLKHRRDGGAWRTWWKENESTFDLKPMNDAEYAIEHAKLIEEMGEAVIQADFFEREVTGKNMLFLLDVSHSMVKPTKEQNESRIARLKEELRFLVSRLDAGHSIGFILFPRDAFPSRGIEPVDANFRERASRFIDKVEAAGRTPMGRAIDHAFEKVVPEYNVDTIYLLSDGVPTDVTSEKLLKDMLIYIDRYGVTINCLSIGDESDLLKEIAKASGGQYWEIQ